MKYNQFPIIDIHTHTGFDLKRAFNGIYPSTQSIYDLKMKMNDAGVTHAVTFPFGPTLYDNPNIYDKNKKTGLMEFPYKAENQLILDQVEWFSKGEILPFFAIDPNRKVPQQIKLIKKALKKNLIYGFKLHTKSILAKATALIDSPFIKVAMEYELPFLIHSWMQDVADPINILTVAKKYKKVNFAVAHMGAYIKYFYTELDKSDYENVFLDTSPLTANCSFATEDSEERGYKILKLPYSKPHLLLKKLFNKYKDRIVFGSDEPFSTYINGKQIVYSSMKQELKLIRNLPLKDFRKITYSNPFRFLGKKAKLI